jgi:hypothetical protein
MLIDFHYISREKKRLSGDKYLSNIYTFCGVTESAHVSPNDTSLRDTSQYDTSNDTSNDTSPRDTEVEELNKVVENSNFLKMELRKEGVDFAKANRMSDQLIAKSWNKFKIHYGKEPADWLKCWKMWVLNEKIPAGNEEALGGEELNISRLGSANWRRARNMSLDPEQVRLLNSWEAVNGHVTWTSLREW